MWIGRYGRVRTRTLGFRTDTFRAAYRRTPAQATQLRRLPLDFRGLPAASAAPGGGGRGAAAPRAGPRGGGGGGGARTGPRGRPGPAGGRPPPGGAPPAPGGARPGRRGRAPGG